MSLFELISLKKAGVERQEAEGQLNDCFQKSEIKTVQSPPALCPLPSEAEASVKANKNPEEILNLETQITELLEEKEKINSDRADLKQAAIEQAKPYLKTRQGEKRDKLHEAVNQAQYNWLSDLVYILMGEGCERGYVEINSQGDILIKQPQLELLEALKKARLTIGLSSTLDVKEMAMSLMINEDDIIAVRRPLSSKDNVTLPVYPIAPNSNRWDKKGNNQQLERMRLAIERLKAHRDVPVYTLKKYHQSLGANRWYGNHDIGFNLDSGETEIIFAGELFPDEGVLKRRYLLLNGSLDGFEAYYEYKRQNAWIQRIGRARTNRYPDKQFTLSLMAASKYADFSFLGELGYQPLLQSIGALGEEVIPANKRKKFQIFQEIKTRLVQGVKLTQVGLAEVCQVSQAYISKIAKGVGGWKNLINLFAPVVGSLKEAIRVELTPEQKECCQAAGDALEPIIDSLNYLDQQALERIITALFDSIDDALAPWHGIVQHLSRRAREQLVYIFFSLLPSVKFNLNTS